MAAWSSSAPQVTYATNAARRNGVNLNTVVSDALRRYLDREDRVA
jgi:hypothetical protein